MTTFGRRIRLLTVSVLSCGLVGCGLVVPDIKEAWDVDKSLPSDGDVVAIPAGGQIETEIKIRVYCELEKAVKYVNEHYPVYLGSAPNVKLRPIPSDWVAQVSLSLQVDESSSLSPGVALINNLPNAVQTFRPGNTVTSAQSRSIGFGGTLSSTATRIDKFNPMYAISYLMRPDNPKSPCVDPKYDPFRQAGLNPASSSPFILESDLGILKWLEGAVITNVLLPSRPPAGIGSAAKSGAGGAIGGGGLKTDAYSIEIKFVIVSSGNVTPTWKLVRVTANTTGTFFSTGRTRTHDLIITIGPLDQSSLYAHLASEIGQAVSGANGARLMPQE